MIKVFIFVFNRPDLLEDQVELLRRYSQNQLDIIVVQDNHNNEFNDEFDNLCGNLFLKLIRLNSFNYGNPSQNHGNVLNYVYNNYIEENDICLFLDHDMFMIKELNFLEFLSGSAAAGTIQTRGEIHYFWPGVFLFNYKLINHLEIDFLPRVYNNFALDTGGGTHNLFKNKLQLKFPEVSYPRTYNGIDVSNFDYPFETHFNGVFLHMRNASQWNNNYQITDNEKSDIIKSIIKKVNY